jgi:hypothetical protein
VRWHDYVTGVGRPAFATVAAAMLLAFARPWLPSAAPLPRLLVALMVFAAGYLTAWLALPGGPRRARDVLAMVTTLVPRP